MYVIETETGFVLPHPEGPIQARFTGADPYVEHLNKDLDSLGREHRGASPYMFGPVNYDPYYGGDPFYLSPLVVACTKELTRRGKIEPALNMLDQVLRWPDNCVRGESYVELAKAAADKNYTELAIGIVLDNTRVFAGRQPQTFDEIAGEHQPAQRVQLAADWLGHACLVYRITIDGYKRKLPVDLLSQFLEQVDMHIDIIANNLPATSIPEVDEVLMTGESVAKQLGLACEALRRSKQEKRAQRLASIDTAIPYVPPEEVAA